MPTQLAAGTPAGVATSVYQESPKVTSAVSKPFTAAPTRVFAELLATSRTHPSWRWPASFYREENLLAFLEP